MELRDCVPSAEISQALGEPIQETVLTTERDVLGHSPSVLASAGHMAWHFVAMCDGIQPGHPLSLQVINAVRGDLRNPMIVRVVERLVQQKVVRGVMLAEGTIPRAQTPDEHFQAYRVALVDIFPGALYVDDVLFQNPARPLLDGEQRVQGAKYHGYGLLGEFLSRVEKCAKSRNLRAVVLNAAFRTQAVLFAKHGYRLDGSEMSRCAEQLGGGGPMIKEVG